MKSAQGYRRNWHLKIFSIFSSGGHLAYFSGTICAILVGSHLGNIPEKFEFKANYKRRTTDIDFVLSLCSVELKKSNYTKFSAIDAVRRAVHF